MTSYLYTGAHFHKCILNKCVDVRKRDLLNSWKKEFYIYKCFYKRKYSRAVAVAFVFYSQCLPCCVLCEATEQARICGFVVITVLL